MLADVITCVAGAVGEQGLCPPGTVQVLQHVYLIPASEVNAMQFLFGEFDPVRAAQIFTFSLATTVAIWFAAWGTGTVARLVRR